MEQLEALVVVLEKFGNELGNVKSMINEAESEVKKRNTNLKEIIATYKKNLYDGKLNKDLLTSAEREIYERISELRKEMICLENIKKLKQQTLESYSDNSDLSKSSTSSSSLSSSTQSSSSSSSLPEKDKEWWTKEEVTEKLESVDWKKERIDREQMKHVLMIKQGYKVTNATVEEMQKMLQKWTGKSVKWDLMKRCKVKNGKVNFTVRFNRISDRNKIYDMKERINEEGYLIISDALTYVERKERWKMLSVAKKLEADGRSIEYGNKKICIDGQWWKYEWTKGWKKL